MKDLRGEWMQYNEGYRPLNEFPIRGLSTVYLNLDPTLSGHWLRVSSENQYYVFVNGKVRGVYEGVSMLSVDSLMQAT